MAILTPLEMTGVIAFIGVNPDRGAGPESLSAERGVLSLAGLEGDAHAGETRAACVRMKDQYPKGAPIRNARQLTIVSAEELSDVGLAMGLGEPLLPGWLGANLMISGLPRLTELPPGARLVFESGAGLVVDLENEPCSIVGRAIEAHRPGMGRSFKRHAAHKRGVTAWVEREGDIALGMRCRPHIPPQRLWPPTPLGL